MRSAIRPDVIKHTLWDSRSLARFRLVYRSDIYQSMKTNPDKTVSTEFLQELLLSQGFCLNPSLQLRYSAKHIRIVTLCIHYRVCQKSKPLLIYQQIVSKPTDKATFSLELNVEQATEVNANKHLLVLNILSIKYSMYDVKSRRPTTNLY